MRKLWIAVAVFFLLPSGLLIAQEWSAVQKEIWKIEEETMAAFDRGDVEKLMSYISPDYRGSGHGSPVPVDKSLARKQAELMTKTYKIKYYSIQPTAIQVFGNTAIAHYILTMATVSLDGKEAESQTAWTDVFVKQGDKWLIVADNGSEIKR